MSKSSLICNSCGQDNNPTATFCIECGVSFTSSESDKSADIIATKQPDGKSQSETSASASQPMSQSIDPPMMMREMMRNMKPMFIMMPIMFIIMAVVLIFIIFYSDIELPFGN